MSGQRFALLSTSEKRGVEALGRALVDAGFTLLSTGGTAKTLRAADLPVTPVADHTGAVEMMDGRVKTLHPRIHGGILGDRRRHADEAAQHDVAWIDVVVVNLYPFEATVAQGGDASAVIENIDIGGPTMIRAAAKNHAHVLVVVDPDDYDEVAASLSTGADTAALSKRLAVKAFSHTAHYDAVISDHLRSTSEAADSFPPECGVAMRKKQSLRYGENPHQAAAFYVDWPTGGQSLGRMTQLQGKELSFNNIADLDAAVRIAFELKTPAVAIIKHMNPAGCATDPDLSVAFSEALAGDPVSAYGGIVAFNRPLDGPTVETLLAAKTFFEVIVAPGIDARARELLAPRRRLRVIVLPDDWAESQPIGADARRVQGGWLLQDWDHEADFRWDVATERSPTGSEDAALRFAWAVCRGVKSNAIVLVRATDSGFALNGVGAGQMSRVDSVRIAVSKATRPLDRCVLASDAFFPFSDGLKVAAEAGVTGVAQPGGSIRDDDVVAAANEAGVAMVFTATRHFRH